MRALFSFRTLLFLLLLFAIGWLGVAGGREFYHRWQLQQEIVRVRTDVDRLEAENTNLAALVDSFQNDAALELEARRRLNVKKPDEEAVIILPPKDGASSGVSDDWNSTSQTPRKDAPKQEEQGDIVGNMQAWWGFVFE